LLNLASMNQEKTKKSKRRKYDSDYKAEVLKMLASGQSATQIAKLLGMGENLIYRWKSEHKKSEPETVQGQDSLRAENEQLRQKLKRVEAERDILKKAVSIFSQSG
jgi:transposase